MRKLYTMSIIMSLLSMLTVFSVGFSSWLGFKDVTDDKTSDFKSYEVGYMDEYVYIGSVEMFDYTPFYFLHDEDNDDTTPKTKTDTGTISVPCTIDLEKCAAAYSSAGRTWTGELTVSLSLWYEEILDANYKLFENISDGTNSKSISVKVNNTTLTSGVTNNGERIDITYTFTGLANTGTYEFDVDYDFYIPETVTNGSNVNFRVCFGKYLKTPLAVDADGNAVDPTKFHMSVMITSF